MMTLPTAEWIESLHSMSNSLSARLADLDRKEALATAPPGSGETAVPADRLFEWLERRLAEWDGKLTEAAEMARQLEQQLEDRVGSLRNWLDLFARWQEGIQKRMEPTAAPSREPPAR